MSSKEIQENKNTTLRLTSKEFNQLQNTAVHNREPLTHFWENGGVTVTITLAFIIEFGFLDLIEF